MKKLLLSLMLLIPSIASAGVGLTGTFQGPDGKGLNGILTLQLASTKSVRNTCDGGRTVPTTPIIYRIVNGVLQNAGKSIPTSDCLDPFSAFYARVQNLNRETLFQDNWLISSTNIAGTLMELGYLAPASFLPQSPVTVQIPRAILSGPSLSQTINQPNGTVFGLNGVFELQGVGIPPANSSTGNVRLYTDGSNLLASINGSNYASLAFGSGSIGAPNTLAKFDSGGFLASSTIQDDGTTTYAPNLYTQSLNAVKHVGSFGGSNAGLKLAASMAALPSTGGTVDYSDLTNTQTWTSCPFDSLTKFVTVIIGDSDTTITVDCVIPTNVSLWFQGHGVIESAVGKTITINGGLLGPITKHFTCTGSFVISSDQIAEIYPQWWGAKGDNLSASATANTCAFQYAAASVPSTGPFNGGTIKVLNGVYYVNGTIALKDHTRFYGNCLAIVFSSPVPCSELVSTAALPILTGANSITYGVTIEYLSFSGIATTGSQGIGVTGSASGWNVRNNSFDHFGDQAIYIANGVAGYYENNYTTNCLMIRTGRAGYVGCMDINISDAFFIGNVITASVTGTGAIGSGFITGIVNRGANTFMIGNIGHFSQTGIVTTNDLGHMIANRGDNNQGYGIVNLGGRNVFYDNLAYSNSRTATNTYCGMLNSEANNTFTNNRTDDALGDSIQQACGIQDNSSDFGSSPNSSIHYNDNRSFGIAGGEYSFSGASIRGYMDWVGNVMTFSNGLNLSPTSATLSSIFRATRVTAAADYTANPIAASATATVAVTVTGALAGDTVTATPSSNPNSSVSWSAYVSASDTVTIVVSNPTTSTKTMSTVTWTVTSSH